MVSDMVARLGELTSTTLFLTSIQSKMLLSKTGRTILRKQPLVSSKTMNLERLATLPADTFGKKYNDFLQRNAISPDGRSPVG